ncbi:UDP-N-acetylglucosamine 1-carboxyvinyltransferase [Candidatus Aerophobetes bacterium]|nr:UDP-N-acetylglucosamine 1-carboxyvinyltransferase [Candidatus Aerophobetes bacterium]
MEKFVIEGEIPLEGKVKISGAKNAILPLMAACLLAGKSCQLRNVPYLTDITIMSDILKNLGVKVKRDNGQLNIDSSNIYEDKVPFELGSRIRASILTLGPLLARLGHARVSLPGGCKIGKRPIDLHLKGLKEMGTRIKVEDEYIEAFAPHGLKGKEIHLSFPSVGATENIILAASLASGTTVIKNACCSPEILDLIKFLKSMGVRIKREGIDSIKIEGVKETHSVEHSVIPDRIEAGTFILAGIITRGKITIEGVYPEHLRTPLTKLKKMGAKIDCKDKEIKVYGENNHLHSVKITTLPYPGFPTDLQPQMTALSCFAQGVSIITETIFENRFTCIPELQKMGANIKVEGRRIKIKGVSSLKGASLTACNIQGGAALVLAGLAAQGITEVYNVSHVDRGYESLEKKLSILGAKIKRIKEE